MFTFYSTLLLPFLCVFFFLFSLLCFFFAFFSLFFAFFLTFVYASLFFNTKMCFYFETSIFWHIIHLCATHIVRTQPSTKPFSNLKTAVPMLDSVILFMHKYIHIKLYMYRTNVCVCASVCVCFIARERENDEQINVNSGLPLSPLLLRLCIQTHTYTHAHSHRFASDLPDSTSVQRNPFHIYLTFFAEQRFCFLFPRSHFKDCYRPEFSMMLNLIFFFRFLLLLLLIPYSRPFSLLLACVFFFRCQ